MRIVSLVLAFALVGCGGSMPSAGGGNDNAGAGGSGGGGGASVGAGGSTGSGGGGGGGGGGGMTGGGDMGTPPMVPNGTATISGSINGYTVATVKSVVAVVTGSSFNVYIADRADLCTVLQKAASPSSTTFLAFGSTAGMGPHTFPAGAYTYPSGSGSGGGTGGGTGGGSGGGTGGGTGGGGSGMGTRSALIATSDGNCGLTGYNQASTGSFTITAPVDTTAKTVDGSFDITFDTAVQMGEFKGTFSAAVCPNATDIPLSAVSCD